MNPLITLNPNASVAGILASQAVTPSYALLSSELSLSVPALFGNSSTVVGISARGQLLSASVSFQNALQPLQTGIASTDVDLAGITARAQTLVTAFNALQNSIADIEASNRLSPGSLTGANDLARSLDTQALASYANEGSALNSLAQLGISLQPDIYPGGSSRLTLDTEQLAAAFSSDTQGASTLLSSVADAFSTANTTFISRSGSQYPSLDALLQTTTSSDLFSALPQVQPMSLYDLLATQSQNSNINWRQVYAAITEYSVVSQMFV